MIDHKTVAREKTARVIVLRKDEFNVARAEQFGIKFFIFARKVLILLRKGVALLYRDCIFLPQLKQTVECGKVVPFRHTA